MPAASPGGVWQAAATCVSVAIAFVAPLHFFGGQLPRNHPRTIIRRMCCVLITCSLAWLPTAFILRAQGQSSSDLLKALLGVDVPSGAGVLLALALPVAHVLLGFLGPVMMLVMDVLPALSGFTAAGQRRSQTHPSQAQTSKGQFADPQELSRGSIGHLLPMSTVQVIPWASVRNYFFAPLAEEWCFRACMIPILLAQGWSGQASIRWSTGLFGAAHLHLLLEMLWHEGMDIKAAIIAVLFQFAYTSCFGAYAAYLLLQSGTVLAPIAAHIACNVMGVPDFQRMVQHRQSTFLLATTVVGLICFAWTWSIFASPRWYCQGSAEPCLEHMVPKILV